MTKEICVLKDIYIFSSGSHVVQLINLSRGQHKDHVCEIILIWTSGSGGNVIKRNFLSRALSATLFDGAEPFFAILVEGIMRNNSVK